jgi:uncharacterized protein (DUF924 family)
VTLRQSSGQAWVGDVLRFWFALERQQWWNGSTELDSDVRKRFLKLWTDKRRLPVSSFLDDPLTALAGVILFDQFPRNMLRGSAEQYATDHLALQIARSAVDKGFDDRLAKEEKVFLYMPFQHSESLGDQRRSLQLMAALGDDYFLGYARKHHDLIQRFGRFPHRNAILGRQPRPDEIAAGDVVPW